MDDDSEATCEKLPSLVWKDPVNGKTAFFTEEVYRQLAGPEPTLEERVMKMMDALGFPPPRRESASRKSERLDAEQRSMGDANFSESCSREGQPASTLPAVEGKTEDGTSSVPGEAVCENEGGGPVEPKQDSPSESETPASPDTPLSPPPQDSVRSEDLEQRVVPSEPGVPPQTGSGECASTSASTSWKSNEPAALGSEISGASLVSGRLPECGEGSRPAMDGSALQPWSQSSMKKDGSIGNTKKDSTVSSIMDTAGQPWHSAHRAKIHDKGRRPPVPEPRKSCLAHEQHVRYLHLFKKCTQRFFSGLAQPPTASELKELQEFESLQMQVVREQEECQAYLKQVSVLSPHLYTGLPPHVAQYTQEKEQSGWKRVDSYSRYYSDSVPLPLLLDIPPSTAGAPSLPAMTLVQTLLELGSKCRLVMPDLHPNPNARGRRTVCTELQRVAARFPSTHTSNQRSWNHEPASKDSNLEGLVHKYPCQVATSASVLQQLIDNHAPDFGIAWDIPVVVRDYGTGAASRRVAFLDKPLLPRVRSLCEKKAQFLKKAVRAYVCQPHSERRSVGGRGRTGKDVAPEDGTEPGDGNAGHGRPLTMEAEEEEDPFGSVSMDDLETFGSHKLPSRSDRKVAGAGRQREVSTVSRTPGSSASGGSGAEVPVLVTKLEVPDHVLESVQTYDTRSGNNVTRAGVVAEADHLSEEKDSTITVKTEADSSADVENTSAGSCQRGSGTGVGELCSESDEDALVIADVFSPVKTSSSSARFPQHTMQRRSQDSRSSIFDEIPGPTTPTSNSSEMQVQGQTSEFTPSRRITRSVSQRLMSPDAKGERSSSVTDMGQTETPESESMGGSASENMAAASAVASLRTTRQSLKRKLSGAGAPTEEPEGCSVAAEDPACSKRGRKVAERTGSPTKRMSSAVKTSQSDPDRRGENAGVEEKSGSCVGELAPQKQTKAKEKQGPDAAPSYLDSLLSEMTLLGNSTDVKLQEDPSLYRPPACTGEHVGYHLWDLSGVAVMVRCNSHAFIRDVQQQRRAVYVSAKPERQIPHGLEQNTLSECTRGWLGCYLRPNSYLLRVRVNMQNYEVVHTEELQLNQILQPTLNFSPHHAFAVLKNILTKLTELPPGNYLLSHEAGASQVLLKSGTSTRRSSHDLRAHYLGLTMQEADRGVPWVPVDPTLMLPYHWRVGLIPATFQPPDFDPKRKKQQQFVPPKKKHRNKKKQK